MPRTRPIALPAALSQLAPAYDLVLSDVWGVVHNGERAFAPACEALRGFRRGGGTVVLITNAPRPSGPLLDQLDGYGVARDAYDAIVSSGDVTLDLMAARGDAPVHFIGPDRDLTLFAELAAAFGAAPPSTALEAAEYVVCTGLRDDDRETPDDYEPQLRAMASLGKPMVCANPDLVVHRGADLLYCAGALAKRFEELGGVVAYAGKPYQPIYELALAKAARARGGREIDPARVLAIGDALRTDVAGAHAMGFDCLFIADGIHREAVIRDGALDPAALASLFAESARPPKGAMARLA